MEEEDAREVELSTLTAIYPELQVDERDSHTVSIELPVSLTKPLTVLFPAVSEAAPPTGTPDITVPGVPNVDSQSLSHLPSLQVRITLPDGYPQMEAPKVVISTSPPWLPEDVLRKLEHDAERLWEELGRDQVVFAYIDDLQQSTDNLFGLVNGKGTLEVPTEHKIAILDYDIKAKRKAFEKETFDCAICLEPKKGSICHRMVDCGHVFCVQCLQDFYNNAITEGDVAAVQCLEPKCAQEREKREAAAQGSSAKKRRRPKIFISPSELLQIPLDQQIVRRYVALKYKNELESDKNTVYCPRTWCQGAARSKKHKKPEGFEFAEGSDEESDAEAAPEKADEMAKKKFDVNKELLSICEDCGFAFCSRCGQSWHGEFKYCIPKERKEEITEEEKASLDYLRMHTTPCPTCASPCQKTQGCNHMRCFRCQTHFCYLCSAWLDPANPYQHFNAQPNGQVNGCFMRLWELEGGDGADIGIAYVGGGAVRNANIPADEYGQHLEILEVVGRDEARDGPDNAGPAAEAAGGQVQGQRPGQAEHQQQEQQRANGGAAVAREGPLVLRIEGGPPRAQARGAARRAPAAAAVGRGGAQPANRDGRGGRGGRGNRRGRGPRANRQNDGMPMQGQNLRLNNNAPGGQGIGDLLRQEGELDPNQAAWIRQFVQLALMDQEDLVDWDND
ncbi:hypothetical protein DL766_007792 [Monosporascus sp. MC13-8B]|uniref:RBR-type E3 ubiquitin transferase n=1 Tax=Monosporascus cannonballus TaxID=155416 RepID=A0ABY0H4L0_9PEZI|nr:hypothetical protein DL763_008960 [Monosporascus cannonballus]RYO82429.1 hypothetical protein DL762_006631 [Monosporascus cannonballus]RYP22068.1 hypothetical protein DL766_007792 [Monosporascus sp. MC13-8B]